MRGCDNIKSRIQLIKEFCEYRKIHTKDENPNSFEKENQQTHGEISSSKICDHCSHTSGVGCVECIQSGYKGFKGRKLSSVS